MPNSRVKGASSEREVAAILNDHLGLNLCRNLSQTRQGGDDLEGSGPFSFEVKRKASGYLHAWWEQCVRQAGDRIPVLLYRFDRQPWVMEIRAVDMMPNVCNRDIRVTVPLERGGIEILRELM